MRRDPWRLEASSWLGEAVIASWADAPGATSRAEDLRLVLAELPRWAEDTTGAAALREMLVELQGDLFAPLLLDPRRDILPRIEEGLTTGRLVVLAITSRAAPAPWITSVGPQKRPPTLRPIPPKAEERTWFEVRLVDDLGDPIPGIELRLSSVGVTRNVVTNGAGVARLEDMDTSFMDVHVVDAASLRATLGPRWTKPRKPQLPSATPLFVRELDVSLEPVSIESEVPATIAITPFFRCLEIPGTHFAFGRSFVRREAVEPLARIAEDLHGQPIRRAMIFAHTDRVGAEALNKELSERRAKALFALLTHDAAAWDELFTNKWSGGNWSETWGTREVQHMLNALRCAADDGLPVDEDGGQGPRTTQAIRRFQRGDYPDRPAEQAPLVDDGIVGPITRKELFLAYAKRISREPVPPDRIARVNGEAFMGCGEYNPLSLSAKDDESRRGIVFVFDIAAEPQALPCKLRSLAPCRANVDPEPTEIDPDGDPPYRCRVYREVASLCPCNGGAEAIHDLVLQFPHTLAEANQMPHVFVLESEDGTVVQSRSLAAHARAHDEGFVEIYFNDLPVDHRYRMRCEGVEEPYEVFDLTPYDELSSLATGGEEEKVGVLHLAAVEPDTGGLS